MPALRLTSRARVALAVGVALIGVLLSGCGSSSAKEAAPRCGPIVRERFDPRSLQHVLPGMNVASYLTDPPTSGPHQPAPPVHGVQTRPIAKPAQVGILEAGDVLLQYHDVRARDLAQLRKLAGDDVVVAPNPDVGRLHVVATAWLHKQTCVGVDTRGLRHFISTRAHHGPGDHH